MALVIKAVKAAAATSTSKRNKIMFPLQKKYVTDEDVAEFESARERYRSSQREFEKWFSNYVYKMNTGTVKPADHAEAEKRGTALTNAYAESVNAIEKVYNRVASHARTGGVDVDDDNFTRAVFDRLAGREQKKKQRQSKRNETLKK